MVGKRKMRPMILKYLTVMVMLSAPASMVGCGDTDALDEIGSRYQTSSITVDDNGNTEVDVAVTACASGTEPTIGDTWISVTLTSDEDMDFDGYLYEIDVDITPDLASLPDFTLDDISCMIDSNGGSCTSRILLLTPTIKSNIIAEVPGGYPTSFRVTLTPYITYTIIDNIDEHYTAPKQSQGVTLKDVDNCPAASP